MERSAGLAADHPDRVRAEKARDREYRRSEALETDFMASWQGRTTTTSHAEAMKWAKIMTDACGVEALSAILNPGKRFWGLTPFWEAYYIPGTAPLVGSIFVRTQRVKLDALIHEVAHHVCYYRGAYEDGGHGKTFLAVEREIMKHLTKSGKKVLG